MRLPSVALRVVWECRVHRHAQLLLSQAERGPVCIGDFMLREVIGTWWLPGCDLVRGTELDYAWGGPVIAPLGSNFMALWEG